MQENELQDSFWPPVPVALYSPVRERKTEKRKEAGGLKRWRDREKTGASQREWEKIKEGRERRG